MKLCKQHTSHGEEHRYSRKWKKKGRRVAETKTIQRCKYARLGKIQIVIVRVGVLILLIDLIALREMPTRQITSCGILQVLVPAILTMKVAV